MSSLVLARAVKTWISRSSRLRLCWRAWYFFWSCQASGAESSPVRAANWAFFLSTSKKTSELFELGEALLGPCLEVADMLDGGLLRAHVLLLKSARIRVNPPAVKHRKENQSPNRA